MSPKPGPKSKKKKKRAVRDSLKTKSRREFFNYSQENLTKALLEVRESRMSTLQASECFGIPRSTLRDKLKLRTTGYGMTGRESILGGDIETQLVEWLLKLSRSGAPIPKKGLLFSVKHLAEVKRIKNPFKKGLPGDKWFHNFLNRHPEISLKRSEHLSKARSKVTERSLRRWFAETEELLGDNIEILKSGDRNRVYNMDETALYVNPNGELVVSETGKPASKVGTCNKENLTVLVCVNAAGETIPPLALWAYERIPDKVQNKKPPNWSYGKSPNGWMTSEVMYEYICNEFYAYLKKKGVQFPVIIFLDGHSSHLSLPLSEFCAAHGIIIVCLPPNCTNYIQVLDVVYFRPMKVAWFDMKRKFLVDNGCVMQKEDVPKMLQALLDENDFANVIKKGFHCCGMYPFDANNFNYDKLLKPMSDDCEVPVKQFSDSALSMALRVLESKIPQDVLQIFSTTARTSSVITRYKYQGLFEIWRSLRADVFPTDVFPTIEAEEDEAEDDLLLTTADLITFNDDGISVNSNVVNLLTVDEHFDQELPSTTLAQPCPLSESEHQSTPPLEELTITVPVIFNEESVDQSLISPNSKKSIAETSSVDHVSVLRQPRRSKTPTLCEESMEDRRERCSSEPPSPRKTMSTKNVQQILNSYHVFPSKANPTRKVNSVHYPSVITHELWIAMKKEQEEKKLQKEKDKCDRAVKREEAKVRKEQAEILKQERQKAQQEKKEKAEEEKKEKAEEKKNSQNEKKKRPGRPKKENAKPCDQADMVESRDGPVSTVERKSGLRKRKGAPKKQLSSRKKATCRSVLQNVTNEGHSDGTPLTNENPACCVCLELFLSRPGMDWIRCLGCEEWCHEECSPDAAFCEKCT